MAKREKKGSKESSAKSVKADSGRVRKLTRSQKKQVAKKEARKSAPLIGSFRLSWQVLQTLRRFWKPLGGIVLVYLILNIIFASGLSNLSSTVGNVKDDLNSAKGSSSQLFHALGGFSSLVGSAGTNSSQASSVLQSVLIVLESLVIIWALRQLLAGKTIRVKQAYYQAMTPLIPFLLVIAVIIAQLLPLTLGTAALALVLSSISNGAVVTVVFAVLFGFLAAWSIYMVSGSIFALYIVTLPDMQPRQALRSARNLVRFRRWSIMRRVIFLPLAVFALMAVVVIPLILFVSPVVAPVFFLLSMVAILFVHTYLYSLYRGLLG